MLPQPLCPTLRQSTHLPNKIIFSALCKTRLPPLPHSPFQTTSSHGRGPLPLRPPGKLSPNRSSRPCRSRPYRSRPIHPVPSPPGLPAAACVSGENQATTATCQTRNEGCVPPRCSLEEGRSPSASHSGPATSPKSCQKCTTSSTTALSSSEGLASVASR